LGAVSGGQPVVQHLWTERSNSDRGRPQRLGLDETGDQHQVQRTRRALQQVRRTGGEQSGRSFRREDRQPTGLDWSTPNSGVLVINEFGYRKEAAPGQLATWLRAAPIINTSRFVDFEFGGRSTGNYAAYVLADQQLTQLAPVAGQAARGWYAGVSAMYAPPDLNRFSQYYEARLYGIGASAVPAKRYGIRGCFSKCL
jgi:hypothetical protein